MLHLIKKYCLSFEDLLSDINFGVYIYINQYNYVHKYEIYSQIHDFTILRP
jgi:hypothetical protein